MFWSQLEAVWSGGDECEGRSERDNENKSLKHAITHSLMLMNLGRAQSFEEATETLIFVLSFDEKPHLWIAPELNPIKGKTDEDGNKYMMKFSQEPDICALGCLIRDLCGDYFTDMMKEEMMEYH
ncbi:hypothetical protein R1sor_007263 [Riccia sorocarpa]|uniref:Uncharacterized protein n=1 Tax=Riccia sorocarpa TaxID=122646 RepID=A0ABD3HTG2_9MARC